MMKNQLPNDKPENALPVHYSEVVIEELTYEEESGSASAAASSSPI